MPVKTKMEFYISKIFIYIVNFFFIISFSMLKLDFKLEMISLLMTIFVLASIKFFFLKIKK